MSNITLADYVGFIFSEITRARDHADRVAKDMAIAYAKDDVLKHFAVPRFKIPDMELTIPVLISSAKFTTALQFSITEADFTRYVQNRVTSAIQTIVIKRNRIDTDISAIRNEEFTKPIFSQPSLQMAALQPVPDRPQLARPVRGKKAVAIPAPRNVAALITKFYQLLAANSDPSKPENIAQVCFAEIFDAALQQQGLLEEYKLQNPQNQLFNQALAEVVQKIKDNTLISQSKMENLLVNPETNAVKNGSSDATVFTIKARIMEEGLFVKTVRNEETGKDELLVEFE